ncbi:hypothetical protein E2C01_095863 [Portunus trituberculatus]|uniref:Uncharacterized protein n=1 Tax=Portunus trituberculatus TaxID=210409 RepID=A0A5B7K6S7_PORTR|nr:hypothetical protein [Portunus trituberculatus]
MTLYKAQVRHIMEYSPLSWMCSAQSHLSLLNKVQRRAERLLHGAGGLGQQPQADLQWQWHQGQHFFLFYLYHETIAPSEEAQPTLGPWTGFKPVHLETPRTPKHAWFHCTTEKVKEDMVTAFTERLKTLHQQHVPHRQYTSKPTNQP